MMLRIVGGVAVVCGCAGIGMYYAARENFRASELMEFKKALTMLGSEIEHMRSPLTVACKNISKRSGQIVSEMFGNFGETLATTSGDTAYQAWITAAEGVRPTSHLVQADWEVIQDFGKTLGYLDKTMQKNAIDYTIDYLDAKTAELQQHGDKNQRMYRSLGVIAGLLVTVVLW